MKQALLDTDTISFYFRGLSNVVETVDKYLLIHGFINISVVSYYEVMNGLYYKDAKAQLPRFERFIELNHVIPLSLEIAKNAASIYADLRKKGSAIGHNDIMIAASALEHGMVLITNNTSHFARVPRLDIDNWA